MATWDGWEKVLALLKTAGAELSTPITTVSRGLPASFPTDTIRVWYDGNTDSPFSPGDTLGTSQEGLALTVAVFLRMGGGVSIEAEGRLDERLEEADAAVQEALLGSAYLDGSANGIRIENSHAEAVVTTGGQLIRWVEIPIVYGIPDRHEITA